MPEPIPFNKSARNHQAGQPPPRNGERRHPPDRVVRPVRRPEEDPGRRPQPINTSARIAPLTLLAVGCVLLVGIPVVLVASRDDQAQDVVSPAESLQGIASPASPLEGPEGRDLNSIDEVDELPATTPTRTVTPEAKEKPAQGIEITAVRDPGTSRYGDDYYADVTGVRPNSAYTVSVSFDARGESDLARPHGACLINDATGLEARAISVVTSIDERGRYKGAATFPVLQSGEWSFEYGCSLYDGTPVLDASVRGVVGLSQYESRNLNSNRYYALVTDFERSGKSLTVSFVAHGRSNLRDPETSCLTNGSTSRPVVTSELPAYEYYQFPIEASVAAYYAGTLTFEIDPSQDMYSFMYSCDDYSQVALQH